MATRQATKIPCSGFVNPNHCQPIQLWAANNPNKMATMKVLTMYITTPPAGNQLFIHCVHKFLGL